VILALVCIAMPAMACDTAWRDSQWSNRKLVTIDRTKVITDQKDFPVLVNLGYDPDLAAKARRAVEILSAGESISIKPSSILSISRISPVYATRMKEKVKCCGEPPSVLSCLFWKRFSGSGLLPRILCP
jgi:hypothetical protein